MSEVSVKETAVLAALALAAHYFPETVDGDERGAAPFEQAAFLVSGKYQAWERWDSLTHEEKQRITAVYAIAPAEISGLRAFSITARSMLAPLHGDDPDGPGTMLPFELVGDNPFAASAAFPRVGGDLPGYVDRLTARFRRPSGRPKPPDFAGPGTWATQEMFVNGEPEFHSWRCRLGHEYVG